METVTRTYNKLITLKTFKERFEYLKLPGIVGEPTFGFDRWINQIFYRTQEWRKVRDYVITRDNGCDLALPDYELRERILIHHMNPITSKDILRKTEYLLNPNYLVCTSHRTHTAIHYGSDIPEDRFAIRTKNDTCPWRN